MSGGLAKWIQQFSEFAMELLEARSTLINHEILIKYCHALMSRKGEATGLALAGTIVDGLTKLPEDELIPFIQKLDQEFGHDKAALEKAWSHYNSNPNDTNAQKFQYSAQSQRVELFKRINTAPGGLFTLVSLRARLRMILHEHPEFAVIDKELQSLFETWFNKGFLSLERINWHTSAAILEKLIEYESVHEIKGWDDLRRRLAEDRLCFAYFHPLMPDEPLIFVEVALVDDISNSIEALLESEPKSAEEANTAVFYSINNCQPGLVGVSFGNLLIKQVVNTLQQSHPQCKRFVTLSPIPKFSRWLSTHYQTQYQQAQDGTHDDKLMALACHYLTSFQNGRVIDPVAHFHLGNGATLFRINKAADQSAKGLSQSFGMMVNYLYEWDDIIKNHEQLMEHGRIALSKDIQNIMKKYPLTSFQDDQSCTD